MKKPMVGLVKKLEYLERGGEDSSKFVCVDCVGEADLRLHVECDSIIGACVFVKIDCNIPFCKMADDRNLTAHTYDEEFAQQMVTKIVEYDLLLRCWYEKMIK